jgi:2-polyprenyl-6-methoxyphenol hydroxylase-like FAD-dependent oxidoreductase
MMENDRIGIIGGGIGGIATAVALHQRGIGVRVYERADRLREVGAGMMLWPNATRVLRAIGLLGEVTLCSGPSTHFFVRSASGRILMNIALGEFDVPALCTRRADLLAILLRALPPECVRVGHELEHFEQTSDSVRVRFKNGVAEEHTALIGADGSRSRVRSALFGASEPIYRGYTVWRGLVQYRGRAILSGCNSESWGRGKRFGILNTGRGDFTWYATANVRHDHLDGAGGRKGELQEMFGRWHEPIAEFLEATDESAILKHGARDRPPLSRWGHGRITLLGDAAHPCTPNLGQGGCMALEDALVLAQCLEGETDLVRGLRHYEVLRRTRTRHMQQRSLLMGRIGQWQNPVFVRGRRLVTQLLPARIFERNLRRVYSYGLPT